MYFWWKLIEELKKSWKYAFRFQIETRIEKKGNSDVFLMKIDQGIEEILKFKPRNIAIRMDMVHLCYISFQVPNRDNYRVKRQFRCSFDENWSRNWRILKLKPRNIAIRTDYGELTLNMLTGSKSRHL